MPREKSLILLRFPIHRTTTNLSKLHARSAGQTAMKLLLLLCASLVLPATLPAQQTCDTPARPCINQPHLGDTVISGLMKVDSANGVGGDGTSVLVMLGGKSLGTAETNSDGTFSKTLRTGLPASSRIEVRQSPGGNAETSVPPPILTPKPDLAQQATSAHNALERDYMALQRARGARAPQVKTKEKGQKAVMSVK